MKLIYFQSKNTEWHDFGQLSTWKIKKIFLSFKVGKNFLGIIPARMGSKRLSNKNNRKIGKISLTEISIRSALKSKMLDEIVVTSNDREVLKTANKFKNIQL